MLTDKLKSWFARPFNQDMDVTHWVLLTVLIITVAIFWTRILGHITE